MLMRTDVKKIFILIKMRLTQPKDGTLEQTEKVRYRYKNYDEMYTRNQLTGNQNFVKLRTISIISINQESVLEFSKKVIQATLETESSVLLQAPNALKIVYLNREDGDQVGVIQQRISLNGVENASTAQSYLVTNKSCSF